SVPTAAERVGNFSALLNNPTPAGGPVVIYDPTKPDVGGLRQPFPGNVIPNPNPIGLLFLGNMPHCNYPNPATCDQATSDVDPNFALPGLDPFNAHRFDVHADWV